MEKKDLEQLFREKFKDFQETPDDKVWKSIEASLEKKQKKRIVPIWWQLGGVAALLAVVFYINNPFDNGAVIDKPMITDVEKEDQVNPRTEQNDFKKDIDSSTSFPRSTELTEINASDQESKREKSDDEKNLRKNLINNEPLVTNAPLQKNKQLVSNENPDNLKKNQEQNIQQNVTTVIDNQEAVAEVIDNVDGDLNDKNFNAVDPNNIENSKAAEEVIAENSEENDGKSIFEAIEEQQEEKAVAESSSGKWSVGPAVAPVYFNGIGEGSPVHSNFSPNSKSGNVNLSYGLNIAYELNKRLSVRTGIHRVNYGYDTNEIVFSSSLNASNNQDINNIDYSQGSKTLVVESALSPAAEATNSTADFLARSPQLEGRMVQQIGYMEVPLELNYAMIDKKFGMNLIGGMSSLFLVDNAVSLESDGLVTEMGEANNVNDVNFSANIGLGLNYKFSNKIQANLEPVFKYQLNTFSNTAGDFRPFSIGVYSGLSFKF